MASKMGLRMMVVAFREVKVNVPQVHSEKRFCEDSRCVHWTSPGA